MRICIASSRIRDSIASTSGSAAVADPGSPFRIAETSSYANRFRTRIAPLAKRTCPFCKFDVNSICTVFT